MKYIYKSVKEENLQEILDSIGVQGNMLKFCFPFTRVIPNTFNPNNPIVEIWFNLIFEQVN